MPEAFLPAAPGLPKPMGRRQNPQIGLTDTLTNRNTSALRTTGMLKRQKQYVNKKPQQNPVSCLRSSFKKLSGAIKPFPGLREHSRDVSFVPLNHKNSG